MAGESAEGPPVPLNQTASVDVDQALKNAGVPGLDLKARQDVNDVLKNAEVKPEIFGGMENDPRIGTIKEELTGAWELLHGSRFDKDGVLRGAYQDYIFGNPADLKQDKKPVSLDDRAKQVFRERFPDDARTYDEQEKIRVYDNPNQDPALKSVEEEILRRTNTDPEVSQARTNYGQVWTKVHGRFSMNAWNNFTRQYPEKAAAYKDRFGPLQQVFEGQERLRHYQEQQSQVASNRAQGLEGSGNYQAGITGGLSIQPDISEVTPEQPERFDPTILLRTESIAVDDFFNLDRDNIYGTLHTLAGIHRDPKIRERAQRIIDLIMGGKENYLQKYPGSTTINFL